MMEIEDGVFSDEPAELDIRSFVNINTAATPALFKLQETAGENANYFQNSQSNTFPLFSYPPANDFQQVDYIGEYHEPQSNMIDSHLYYHPNNNNNNMNQVDSFQQEDASLNALSIPVLAAQTSYSIGVCCSEKQEPNKKRKYQKKSLLKFIEIEGNFDSNRSAMLHVTPIYPPIPDSLPFILIGGDFFYHLPSGLHNANKNRISSSSISSSNNNSYHKNVIMSLNDSQHQFNSKTYESLSLSSDDFDSGLLLCNRSNNNYNYSYQDKLHSTSSIISNAYIDESGELVEEPVQQLNLFKEIVQIQKFDRFINVKVANKLTGILDFRGFISTINDLLIAYSGESHLDQLLKLQEYLERCSSTVERIMQLYPDFTELIRLQESRFSHIKQLIKSTVETAYAVDEDFIVLGMKMIDLKTKMPTLDNICFNKKLVELIGSNFEQLENHFLRKGLKDFFDFKTRLMIQQQHIETLIDQKSKFFEQPFTLITYDNYKIPCRIQIEMIYAQLPQHLKYDKQGIEDPFEVHEGGFVARLILSDQQIHEVNELRRFANAGGQTQEGSQSYSLEQQQQQQSPVTVQVQALNTIKLEEDISYTVQSQYLIEKYYPNELKKMMKTDTSYIGNGLEQESKQEAIIPDPFDSIRCKFKSIATSNNHNN